MIESEGERGERRAEEIFAELRIRKPFLSFYTPKITINLFVTFCAERT